MPSSKARKLADLFGGSGDGGSIAPNLVSDLTNTSTGYFDLPSGTTAERPENPTTGSLRYNSDLGFTEQYTATGWQAIAAPPLVNSITPESFDGSSGSAFTVSGSNFDSNATVEFITAGGSASNAGSVSYVSSSELTVTTGQNYSVADEPLTIKVTNGTGLSSTVADAIDCGGVPIWTTASGSLGTFLANESISVQLQATDPEGTTVSYAIISGTLPSGVSMSSSGLISGTAPELAADEVFNISVNASDGINTTTRPFSITVRGTNYFGDGSDGVGSY